MTTLKEAPPRDNLFRSAGFDLRQVEGEDPTLFGHFAVFNEWTEIDSLFEGRFLERIAPGAFKKTMQENRSNIRVLFQHGYDPQIGDQVLGKIKELREDRIGAYYEVPLFDGIPPLILNGLRAGTYGASFRFRIIKEEFNRDPEPSDFNPEGIPERTILELSLQEFGPVTFPAYEGATAQARSLTDEMRKREPERPTPVITEPAQATPAPEPARATPQPTEKKKEVKELESIDHLRTVEELESRQTYIRSRLNEIDKEYAGQELPPQARSEWDELDQEDEAIERRVKHLEERRSTLERKSAEADTKIESERVTDNVRTRSNSSKISDPFNLHEYRKASNSPDHEAFLMREGAMRIVEGARFPGEDVDEARAKAHVERMLDTIDSSEDDAQGAQGALARRIIATGSPVYRRAFAKTLMGQPVNDAEQRALSLTGGSGGFAVPFQMDPTILNTSNGVVNPIRQIARVIPITGDEWRGVSSAGITATYEAEATETTDNAPTLTQPTISTEKAQAFVPYSIEIGQDWQTLENEMGTLLADAKDTLEATKFITGTGTNEPFGLLAGVTNTVNAAAGADAFTLANLYSLKGALPPRYRARASWLADGLIFDRVRQMGTVGSNTWVDGIQSDNPPQLLGKPAYEASAMPDDATTGNKFLVFGDFSRYVIVDRIGLNIETIPHLMGANRRPTGQRGLYAYWRNGAKVVDSNAFRALLGTA